VTGTLVRRPAGTEKCTVATVTVVAFGLRRAAAGAATRTGADPRAVTRVVNVAVPLQWAPDTPWHVIGSEAEAPRTDTAPSDADGGPAGTTTVTVAAAEAPATFVAT
jgi:hypothetical protein